MTIKYLDKNISAENIITLYDVNVIRDSNNKIISVNFTRKNFYDEEDGITYDLTDDFYTKQEIDERIKIRIEIFESTDDFPEIGKTNYIYLVPFTSAEDTKEGVFKEYVWVGDDEEGSYEAVGSTEIDLSPIRSDIENLKINKLDKNQGSSNKNKNVVTDNSGNITTEAKPTIDNELKTNSTNAVQNKVITEEINSIESDISSLQQNKLDKAQGSSNKNKNVVTDNSGNITTETKPVIDNELSDSSENAVQNKVITTALNSKVNSGDVGGTVTAEETNPVSGKAVKNYVDETVRSSFDTMSSQITQTVTEQMSTSGDYLTRGNVIDDLVHSTDDDLPLSAKMGYELDQKKADKNSVPAVIDNVSSEFTNSALSANQGKYLKSLIDANEVSYTETQQGSSDNSYEIGKIKIGQTETILYGKDTVTNVEGQLSGYVQQSDLADVATSGDYEDLENKPELAIVATSGDYEDLENTPELASVAISGDYSDLENAPELATVATSGDYNDLENVPELADVATSGDYGDLENKPIDYEKSIVLKWKGKNFESSSATNTGSNYHLIGTNMTIDWGDGTIETITANQRFTHTYSKNSTYTIIITGDSITSLGDSCFHSCTGLKSITIPSSVTSLGESCFVNCSGLTNITIPLSVTSLGSYCFSACTGLTSITIPSSITSLGSYCFYGCTGLTSITIPSSITSLGTNCFYRCISLTSIIIPSSVTSLGYYCFDNCTGLTKITFENPTPTVVNPNAWNNIPTTCKIYVPASAINDYKSASNYPDPSTYTYIGIPDEAIDVVTDSDTRAVTSNAVYDYAQPKGNYLTTSDTTKENVSNKVTTLNSSTSNYPSCSAVKTVTDGKADTVHTHNKSQITDLGNEWTLAETKTITGATLKKYTNTLVNMRTIIIIFNNYDMPARTPNLMFNLSNEDIPPVSLQHYIDDDTVIGVGTDGQVGSFSASDIVYSGSVMFFYPILP